MNPSPLRGEGQGWGCSRNLDQGSARGDAPSRATRLAVPGLTLTQPSPIEGEGI